MSIQESGIDFYSPVCKWINEYSLLPAAKTTLDIQFQYFNTKTSQKLFSILKVLEGLYLKGHDVDVNWLYNGDEDTLEAGTDFKELLKLPFHLVEVSDKP